MTELHIVIDKLGFVREQDGRQTLSQVADDLISGQFDDADRVLRVRQGSKAWPGSSGVDDVTEQTAWIIFSKCSNGQHHVMQGSPAYQMVQEYVSIDRALLCLEDEEAAA